ncbi:MAG: GGDEF domain-containing protein [Bacilli bacterium]|nr:GGDEF domain-containing protein [Bacilli bacterium]
MKNKKYLIIGIIIGLLLIVGVGTGVYIYLNSNHLTISEKNWIDDNHTTAQVININVINDAFVFGNNGSGVFYDFINDFKGKYDLNVNEVTFGYGTATTGVTFGAKTSINENDIVFYTDHYVLIGKEYEIIGGIDDLTNKEVAILGRDLSYVSNYVSNNNVKYQSYDSIDDLLKSMEAETRYAIIPLHLYLGDILKSNYSIIYHFSDINMYYTMNTVDDTLSRVLSKYYENWKDEFNEVYNDSLFDLMVSSLGITETEIDAMQSVTYEYGYLNNSPYEVISSGNYGGIAAVYLDGFMDFADIEFNFKKYRNFNKFNKAINKEEVDIYFGYYNLNNNFAKTLSGINVEYSVIANSKNDIVINSVNSLVGKDVYVDENSILYTYLKNISGINIKTYRNTKELLKLNRKDEIILIDSNIFEYYRSHGLENYTLRFENDINYIYGFNVRTSSAMYRLLNEYMSITDSHRVLNEGYYNHEKTVNSGWFLSLLAKYFIYFLLIFALVAIIVVRKTRKITIAKKIKKDDKLRFIDQLTLLKNRNYLTENIKEWSNNTIYPQTILVVDLNHLQHINDIEGYEEGDKQIKAAANALIKTQLDNSDIIRTDGNEFVVYMVGYSQKQVTNYIHKLNKEFKKLPYDYGAEFGYSMILDDIKTIEDALNEATKALKEQKELNESKN